MNFSVIGFTETAAYVVIFAFFWRSLATYLANKTDGSTAAEFGKGMGFLF